MVANRIISLEPVQTAEPFENFAKSNAMSGGWHEDGVWRGQIQIYGEIKWRWFQFTPAEPPAMNVTILGPHVKFKRTWNPETRDYDLCPVNRPW